MPDTMTDYTTASEAVVERASAELSAAWLALPGYGDVSQVKRVMLPVFLALTSQYGEAATALALMAAEEMLNKRVPKLRLPDPLGRLEAAKSSFRIGLGPLYGPPSATRPDDALSLLDGSLTRHVLEPAREVMVEAAVRTNSYFRRQLAGSNPCAWCRMLAARGSVYHSAASAGEMRKWHDGCRCTIVLSS